MAAAFRGNLMRNTFIASILAFGSILSVPAIAAGVDSVFEIVPNGEHVMTNLIGAPFIQKLEKLR
jgi:hypothetical protein